MLKPLNFSSKITSKHRNKILIGALLLCCLLLSYLTAYFYIKQYLSAFVETQRNSLKLNHLDFQFQDESYSKWNITPQLQLTNLTLLQKRPNAVPALLWQTKEIKLYYSLWHPLSIMAEIDGNQIYCTQKKNNECFEIFGSSWNAYFPFLTEQTNIYLFTDNINYIDKHSVETEIKSFKLEKVNAVVNFVSTSNVINSASIKVDIHNIILNIKQLFSEEYKHIKLQNNSLKAILLNHRKQENAYKILVQQADFKWDNLSFNSSGKVTTSFPYTFWTGELDVNINGLQNGIYQQLSILNCCEHLKEELYQTTLPPQINFTVLIRDNTPYIGAVPLQPSWYTTLKTMMQTYAK